jgi:cobalt-zinc-cadmium efflux system outer membrane protein
MHVRLPGMVLIACLLYAKVGKAQTGDTLRLTLPMLEGQFLKNNLQLLAQRYNVDKAAAGEMTAKLFANPSFSFTNGLYTKTKDTNALSQQTYSISQLIQTAGKRNKSIQLARIQTANAWHDFFDLLRTLKYSLRNNFYTLFLKQQSIQLYNEEISSLKKTLTAFQLIYQKGNIAEKEVLRIQSLLYALQSEQTELQLQANDLQAELRTFIQSPGTVQIQVQMPATPFLLATPAKTLYLQLLDSALANRHDLKLAQSNVTYAGVNLNLQNAMKYPDLTVSLNYDKKAGYGLGYVSGGLAMALPFFNRNQGGIRLARIQLEQSKVQLQGEQNKLENELSGAYQDVLKLESLYRSIDTSFKSNFARIIQGAHENFEKRNISLLEFLDLYASYKNHMLLMNNLMFQRINALEKLNFITGTEFFNP